VRELSDDLGISHTPIKEALNRLVAEGYIDAAPRKSMVVRKVNIDDFESVVELRAIYEVIVLNRIMRNKVELSECVNNMRTILEQLNILLSNDEIEYHHWLEYDFMFHCTYMQLSDNHAMFEAYKTLNANRHSYFMFLEKMKRPLTREDLRKDNIDHEEILECFERNDLEAALKVVTKHILRPRLEVVISDKVVEYVNNFTDKISF